MGLFSLSGLSSFVVVVVVVDATVAVQIRTDHGNINRRRRRKSKTKGKPRLHTPAFLFGQHTKSPSIYYFTAFPPVHYDNSVPIVIELCF
jgi:hypothetical protein